MTVRIDPNKGVGGRVAIDERIRKSIQTAQILSGLEIWNHIEGDLCLTMCPGVRMVKGYVQAKGSVKDETSAGGFEVREVFQGWADVREANAIRGSECLHAFEVAIDLEFQLPRSRKRLKLSSAARFNWKKVGGFRKQLFKTVEPSLTHHAGAMLRPEDVKTLAGVCNEMASVVRDLVLKYAEAIFDSIASQRYRKVTCDPKTGRCRWITKRPTG